MTPPRSIRRVVTVGTDGVAIGTSELLAAHTAPGRLHRAVSVVLLDRAGRILVQRRAESKALFGGRWTNSCCTHPRPGETPLATAERRVTEELGVDATDLGERATFVYRAVDPISGLVEHEFDHVFVGCIDDDVRPAPDEVDDVALLPLDRAEALLSSPPATPWAAQVVHLALRSSALVRRRGSA